MIKEQSRAELKLYPKTGQIWWRIWKKVGSQKPVEPRFLQLSLVSIVVRNIKDWSKWFWGKLCAYFDSQIWHNAVHSPLCSSLQRIHDSSNIRNISNNELFLYYPELFTSSAPAPIISSPISTQSSVNDHHPCSSSPTTTCSSSPSLPRPYSYS